MKNIPTFISVLTKKQLSRVSKQGAKMGASLMRQAMQSSVMALNYAAKTGSQYQVSQSYVK